MTACIDQLNVLATSPPPFLLTSLPSSGGVSNLFSSLGLELGFLTRVKKREREDRSRMPCTGISTFPDLLVQMPQPIHFPLQHQQPRREPPTTHLNLTYHLAQ